jgi:hypothetical protein
VSFSFVQSLKRLTDPVVLAIEPDSVVVVTVTMGVADTIVGIAVALESELAVASAADQRLIEAPCSHKHATVKAYIRISAISLSHMK